MSGSGAGPNAPSFRPRQVQKLPPCAAGCPNGADVRGWLAVIAQRDTLGISLDEAYTRAWHIITDVNPFPSVMGRVCPHPCQDECSRSTKDGAVAVNAMERFIGDRGLELGLSLTMLQADPREETVGVVGSGPAGLSCAYQMARRGYAVTVYERSPQAGGMLRYGIPDYRLPQSILDAEIDRIRDLGVELRLNTAVGPDIPVAELRARHNALFLGIGAQVGRPLGVPGEDGPGVWTGTDYLREVNQGRPVALGRRVAVIGGGNTAVDAARTARRAGAEVVVIYRRTRTEMPAFPAEIEDMLREGVDIEFLAAPSAIERDNGRVTGVVVQRMELGEPDETGRRVPIPVEGSELHIPFDNVIVAVSQGPDWARVEELQPDGGWVDPGEDGRIEEAIWAGGDIRGPGFASLAIAEGRRAAETMDARLRGVSTPARGNGRPLRRQEVKSDYYGERPTLELDALPAELALAQPDAEVMPGITEDQLLEEASRCLSCGLCFGCERCMMYCSATAFVARIEPAPGAYFSLLLDRCRECGKCVDLCPCGFLEFDATASA